MKRLPVVLYNMGTWEKRSITQRAALGLSPVHWHSVGHIFLGMTELQLTCQASFIRYTGITNTTIPSPLRALRSSRPECKTTLPLIHPEVAACLPFANEDLSRAVTATSEICDPRVSSLFDIGRAVELDSSGSSEGFIHIGVVATGECCNSISFRVLEEDSVNLTCLGLQAPAQLRVPCVGDAENTEWSTGGAPIRQVCCARTLEETPTWVAARFPRSTVVFHPLYHRNRVPMHVSRGENYTAPSKARNSRLNANPLVEIANSQTGGFAHADVTFNPWYQKQLGIVDERGNWSVWEISGLQRLNKSTWSTACIRSGSLPWLDIGGGSDGRSTDRLRFDGWGAIEWTGDVNSFVVADRRCLILYRMEGDRIWPYTIELGLDKKSEWILDIKRSHCDVSHVFILTTSRVLFVDVGPVIMSPNEQDKRSSLTPRLSWHHFRDPGDTTMLLSPILVDEGMTSTRQTFLHFLMIAS